MPNLHVRDLMTSDVFAVGLDESIAALPDLMTRKRIRHVLSSTTTARYWAYRSATCSSGPSSRKTTK